jgi:Virulence-associated protein E
MLEEAQELIEEEEKTRPQAIVTATKRELSANIDIGDLANMTPELTKQGGLVKKSYINTAIAMTQYLDIRGHHDIFADRREIFFKGELIDLNDKACRAVQAGVAERLCCDGGIENIRAIASHLCEINAYHPVKDYLEALTWDKTTRLGQWLKLAFGCNQPTTYLQRVGTMFPISMVARIMQPGCQADYMPIFEGEQGKRKSTALRELAVNPDWFSDNLPDLRKGDPVRISMHMKGKWLFEAPEMHATGNADNSLVKGFVTRREERYVPKHARFEVNEPRQCIFAGTTNKEAYFTDESGERRYWPIWVETVDIDWIKANRDQLWAEAMDAYRRGVTWWPDAEFEEKHIKPEQRERKVTRAWEEPIRKYLVGQRWPIGEPGEFQLNIWKHLSEDRYNPNAKAKTEADFTNGHYQEICKVLKDLGYKNNPRWNSEKKEMERKWWPPAA